MSLREFFGLAPPKGQRFCSNCRHYVGWTKEPTCWAKSNMSWSFWGRDWYSQECSAEFATEPWVKNKNNDCEDWGAHSDTAGAY